MKKLSPRQIDAVLQLPGSKRYDHFVKQVADWEEAWGLFSDGWALAGADDGRDVFPLWPAKEYASLCASGDWAAYVPKAISLGHLVSVLLPRLQDDGLWAGVFYTPADKGVTVEPPQLLDDLREEAGQYE